MEISQQSLSTLTMPRLYGWHVHLFEKQKEEKKQEKFIPVWDVAQNIFFHCINETYTIKPYIICCNESDHM